MAFPLAEAAGSLARLQTWKKLKGTLYSGHRARQTLWWAFLVDTTNRLIKEQYEHYRPHLELVILTGRRAIYLQSIVGHYQIQRNLLIWWTMRDSNTISAKIGWKLLRVMSIREALWYFTSSKDNNVIVHGWYSTMDSTLDFLWK